ncbi:MAG TPA: M20/M25/M40 family metallo-hydrolase [candidate division Zixibacteria bacterium]|nr:M20/M25/M40 family metallo-hydrolase [candidate division Zixibacteria bacterium]
MRPLFGAALLAVASCWAPLGAGAVEDWGTVEARAVALLGRYLRIDTSNPPGNEILAARFFKEIFDGEGIEAKVIESAPGRGNVYARLPGRGAKPAVVLLNHMDVVPADPGSWKEPPFSGAVRDGYMWGRGALDMKGPAILQLFALLELKRRGVPLAADLVFLGTADEEAGGALGLGHLLEAEPGLFAGVGLVLSEGGGIRVGRDGRPRQFNVRVAEKAPLWLRLIARGAPGHGASPGRDSAVASLIRALGRLAEYRPPIRVLPEVQKFYADTAAAAPPERRERYRDLRKALQDPEFAREFTRDPRDAGAVRNTIAITRLHASDKINVVPARAWAELDVRLLPGENPEAFIAELRRVIADDSIAIEVLLSFPPARSPGHPEAFRVLGAMARRAGVPLLSPLGRGFTDCRFFRERNVPCLGFVPLAQSPASEGLAHGVDERISLDAFRSGLRAMFELVRELAVTP